MIKIEGDRCHAALIDQLQPILAYDKGADYSAWKKEIREKLAQLLGDMPPLRPVSVQVEYERRMDGYTETRFVYESEENCLVPAYLLVPEGTEKYPVAVCLQGHSTGMHISLGIKKYEGDEKLFPSQTHALHAVKNGCAALVIEQRGMGERRSPLTLDDRFATSTALLLGRTIIGERVWDISRGIDALQYFAGAGAGLDLSRIVCLGNSGGGTATYYAAATDERISLAVVSCALCSYKDSIGAVYHCGCNYIPGALKWFDMGDLACLIAPRKLIVAAGEKDEIFPLQGVKKVMKTVGAVYDCEGASQNLRFIQTDKAHWFSHELIWPAIREML